MGDVGTGKQQWYKDGGGGGAAKSGANLSDPQRARQHQNHGGTF